ncbi:MAG: helix-turn-helix transcriptional regulator [Betaproteobacteria bacterium]|nr:helix-turn-helix transcriptional regulator [Betaproteobacteria bacterium]
MDTPISLRMKEKGFRSDAALAAKVGCDRSMITRVKLGKASPSLDLAVKLSAELNLPASAFLRAPQAEDAA